MAINEKYLEELFELEAQCGALAGKVETPKESNPKPSKTKD